MTMTDREVRNEARRRAKAGFLWLTAEGRTLALDGRINPKTVDLSDGLRCPLAQAGRSTYTEVLGRLARCGFRDVENFLIGKGFVAEGQVDNEALTEAWRNLLTLHSVIHEAEEALA